MDGILTKEQLDALERGEGSPETVTVAATANGSAPAFVPVPVWTPSDDPAEPSSRVVPIERAASSAPQSRGNVPRSRLPQAVPEDVSEMADAAAALAAEIREAFPDAPPAAVKWLLAGNLKSRRTRREE